MLNNANGLLSRLHIWRQIYLVLFFLMNPKEGRLNCLCIAMFIQSCTVLTTNYPYQADPAGGHFPELVKASWSTHNVPKALNIIFLEMPRSYIPWAPTLLLLLSYSMLPVSSPPRLLCPQKSPTNPPLLLFGEISHEIFRLSLLKSAPINSIVRAVSMRKMTALHCWYPAVCHGRDTSCYLSCQWLIATYVWAYVRRGLSFSSEWINSSIFCLSCLWGC